MAKQLDFIKLLIEGTESGAVSAQFVYRVCDSDDSNLAKVVHLAVSSPDFSNGMDTFFNSYVAIIKTNESIS